MIVSATLSKPISDISEILGRPYLRIKIRAVNSNGKTAYFFESFTETQAFHSTKTEEELAEFIELHAGKTFKNATIRTEKKEITILANKRGKITRLEKNLFSLEENCSLSIATKVVKNQAEICKAKKHILQEGKPVPFMVLLGIMTAEGKVISSKYDKFRQINRFLEFISDILPDVIKLKTDNEPLQILDFGSGKSYLTFAVHHYLREIKKIPSNIIGLDLKKDVIDYCNKIAGQLECKGLRFCTGDISSYSSDKKPDIVISLHACDTATDFALDYAVKNDCKAILSVPCCQHEINFQLENNIKEWKKTSGIPKDFAPLLKYGIVKERFSALLTDALRCESLEGAGYSVQLLEFIDMEHTPKNLLIRAVKKSGTKAENLPGEKNILNTLEIFPMLEKLLKNHR